MWTWQFAKAQHIARERGFTQFVSMQNHYNLIYREEEREMIPFCSSEGVGIIPWSPLARGYLSGLFLPLFAELQGNRKRGEKVTGDTIRHKSDAFSTVIHKILTK
jgi:1-deoxyxylulose-5-phosphate synthase